jgi:hypothetical protein
MTGLTDTVQQVPENGDSNDVASSNNKGYPLSCVRSETSLNISRDEFVGADFNIG